jgi:hypothetical protein
MAAPVARSDVFTNANQLKLKGAIAAVNFYYGGAGNADNAVMVTGPIQGVAFDNIDVAKCKPTTGNWGKDKATTVELAGGVRLTVDLLNGMWENLHPGFGLSMDWVNRPLPKWSHESVARTITGDGNDGKHAGELATANVVFEAGKAGGLLTFALGNRFASKDVSVQVIAGGPWGGSVSVTDGTRTIGTIGDGDGTTAKILTFAAKADEEGVVSVGFTGKKNYLGIAGVIVSAAEASAAASAPAASVPSANTTVAGKERPRKIYAMYMGCFPAGRGGTRHISHNVLSEMGAPRSILYDNKGQEIKPPYQNLGAWASRSGGLGPYGKSSNIGLTPYDGKAPSPEESADREIRQAMRIGIDGFSVESSSGGFSQSVRPLIDLMFKICEEKNYPFEITFTVCQNGEEYTSPDLMPYKGNACVKTVKWLLDKHGNSPKLARRDGKPLILGYGTPQYVEGSYWHPYVEKAARKNLGPDAKPEAVQAEVARLHNWTKWKSGDPTTEEAWKMMWLAFQDMEKEIGQPCYWEMDTNYVGPQDPNLIRILAQDFQAFGGFLSLHYFPLTADAAKIVVAAGKEWSQPIQLQYKNNVSRGLDWLRRDWKAARELPSTLLQYITWNDYGETALAPGTNTRYAYYDVTGEFIRWWKTGKEPTSDHDKVYIFSHKLAPNTKIYPFKGGVAHFDHVIEVLTILPKPATLRMPGRKTTEGEDEWTAPAGMSYKQFPLTPGPVSVELLRDGKVELKLDCPDPVSDRPFRGDLEKTCVSTEELRHWQEDFGKDVPMYQYSEYGDVNNNGLPNWFEMFWFGKLGDMSTATNCPDPNAMTPSGKTLLECYREQIDPTAKIPPYADLPKTGLLAWYRADQGVEADAAGKIAKWLDQSGNGLHLTAADTLSWMATDTDLAGQPRLSGSADMGSYEWQRPKSNRGGNAVGTPSSKNGEIGAATIDRVWKVVPGGAGSQSGKDWANAFATIQAGIAAAVDGDTVLVSNGMYTLSEQISLAKAVTIRSLNGPTNTTISGNNAVRLFDISTGATNWWIDGFTLTSGNCGKSGGAGGGALQILGADVKGLISNCIITNNIAGANQAGGGIAAGGGAQTTYRNCLIANNSATVHTGGIAGRSGTGTHTIENCTFYGNTVLGSGLMGGSSFGGELAAGGNSVVNSIFWQGTEPICASNGTQTYTLNAGAAGTGNKTGDPLFVNAAGGNFQLQPSSPCIDSGTNSQHPSLVKSVWNGLPAVELDGLGNKMLCPLPQKDHASMSVFAVYTAHAEDQVSRIQDGKNNRLVSIPTTSKLDSEGGLAMLVNSIDWGDVSVVSRKFDPGQQPTFIGLGAMTDNTGQSRGWNFKGKVAEILIYSPALSEAETYTVTNMLKARYKL